MKEVILKLQNNKSPGIDGIIGYWFKNLNFYINDLVKLFNSILNNEVDIPTWFTRARTKLIAKNSNTHLAENYRPIACPNIISKLYTSCINQFLQDHCDSNKIVTDEQAGAKKEVWGCLEQLIINKTILDQVKKNRRSLITIWLDYKKAFGSVPHEWLFTALELAKVPEKIIEAIKALSKQWSTNLIINGKSETFMSDLIRYLRGRFQGDNLSVLLFILAVNPLSFLLNKLKGYKMGSSSNRNTNITHLFFVDDLKLYASNLQEATKLFDLVTTFFNDIRMKFRESKCAYLKIKKGLIKQSAHYLEINVCIKPIKEGESYKYLGQDKTLDM